MDRIGYPADGYEDVRAQIVSDAESMVDELPADGFLTIQYMCTTGRRIISKQ